METLLPSQQPGPWFPASHTVDKTAATQQNCCVCLCACAHICVCVSHLFFSSASHPPHQWTRMSVEQRKKTNKTRRRSYYFSNLSRVAQKEKQQPRRWWLHQHFTDHICDFRWDSSRFHEAAVSSADAVLTERQAKGKPPVYQQRSSWLRPPRCASVWALMWWVTGLRVTVHSGSCADLVTLHRK